MRKLVWGLIALASLAALQGSAEARERRFLLMVWDDGRPEYSQPPIQPTQPQPQPQPQPQVQPIQPQPQQETYYQPEQRPGLFDRMMDVERRKNAWLRQSFFGY